MKKITTIIVFILALMSLDQSSKIWAMHSLPKFDGPSFYQSGSVTSVGWELHRQEPLIRWFTAIFGIYLIVLFWTSKMPLFVLSLWTAGGLSNLIEMATRGYVVDFLVIRWGDSAFIGNVADCYILVSLLTLVFMAPSLKWRNMMIGSRFDIKF